MKTMMNKDPKIRAIVQDLRAAYVPNEAYHQLEDHFCRLLEQRRADMEDGRVTDLRGIVLIGRSGSGKSRAVSEMVRRSHNMILSDPMQEICEFISLQVPSPATMKFVGTAVLQAAGYPLSRDKSASTIWDMVRQQLMFRRTLFLHLDEAQDLTRFQTENERRSVVNTLKSLMQNSRWPAGLILSGMPELKIIINQDPQLSRRLYPVEIDRLNEFRHVGPVLDLVGRYADRAGIATDDELSQDSFARRLMHAADYEFGLLAEIVVETIKKALLASGRDVVLCRLHFADVFHHRSGAVDGLNPFLAEDYRRIDPRQLLGGAGGMWTDMDPDVGDFGRDDIGDGTDGDCDDTDGDGREGRAWPPAARPGR